MPESTTTKPAPQASTTLVWACSILSALFASGYGVLFTIGGEYRDQFGIQEATFGLIIGVGFIVAVIGQVLFGPLGDQGHARALVLGGAVVNCIGLLMMGFGTTSAIIIAGRVISGIAIGAAAPAVKRIVIVGSGENTGRNLGRLFSADVFGFAMGPVLSAVLVKPFGLPAPFIVISVLVIVAVAVTLRIPLEEEPNPQPQRLAFDLFQDRAFAGAVMIGSAAFVMIGAFDTLWDLVHTDLGSPEWMSNLGITLFAIPLVILGPSSGKLAQRIGPFVLAATGMVLGALFLGIYGVLSVGGAIFAVTMVHAISDGLTFVASGVAVGLRAPDSRQAAGQGLLGASQALAAGIMAPITGWLYQHQGQQAAYWTAAGVILAMTAMGLLLARDVVGKVLVSDES